MRPVRSSPDNNNLRGNSMKTHGSASWKGGVRDGKGAISAKSGALSAYPYGFSSRPTIPDKISRQEPPSFSG